MEATFKIWEAHRQMCLKLLSSYSLDQLNKVPEGFSNNLIWNVGHMIVTQQALVYRLSGLTSYIEDQIVETYKSGSRPTGRTTAEEVEAIKHLLIFLIEKTKTDYKDGLFKTYHEYNTSTGFNLKTTEEAIE
ncbi:MAG: DinB family protein, partial [Bacteroidota bacterium]